MSAAGRAPEQEEEAAERNGPDASAGALVEYLPYPKAMRRLAERLNATPEELSGWVFLGSDQGGLAAYVNANELAPPPRFRFGDWMDEDYVSLLMGCWFATDDIENFKPSTRFVTGQELTERWSVLPGIQAEPYIEAKVAESRLRCLHPILGLTRAHHPVDDSWPPLTTALFVLDDVEKVEAEDFATEEAVGSTTDTSGPEKGSPEWRRQLAIKAANARHDKVGGNREKQDRIRAIWATGKYTSRDRCAEEECAALNMSFAAARKALVNAPKT